MLSSTDPILAGQQQPRPVVHRRGFTNYALVSPSGDVIVTGGYPGFVALIRDVIMKKHASLNVVIRYLEGKLKLKVNREKSHIAKVNATKKFKFLGFAYSKGKDGLFI